MKRRRLHRSELLRAIGDQLSCDPGSLSRAARTRLVELMRRASATRVKHPTFGRLRRDPEAPSRLDGWLH